MPKKEANKAGLMLNLTYHSWNTEVYRLYNHRSRPPANEMSRHLFHFIFSPFFCIFAIIIRMNELFEKYQLVVGLEVHAQLLTHSKAYSADSAEYGGNPNTHVSPTSLGLPGALPVMNAQTLDYAITLGLALKSNIRYENQFARKNYFYADLPKGYQITQDKTPICNGGYVMIKDDNGQDKKIELERIHMEEDAGKSMHDQDPYDTLIDLNRAGVPLVEIVSRPDIRTPREAYNYLTEIRKLLRHLEICDGNMEEGSMRCDANISVMLKDAKEFGQRVEVKNMNSIRNVQRAIEYEMQRQIEAVERGEVIVQETRNFDAATGTTSPMRTKESANDYRYFPEPDLPPIFITEEKIATVKSLMPPLPDELFYKYTRELGLPEYDAYILTDNKYEALYFEEIIQQTSNVKAASNWMMVHIKSFLNENGLDIKRFEVAPATIAAIIAMIDDGKVSSTAAQQIFKELVKNPQAQPMDIARELNLIQESDSSTIEPLIDEALARYPDKVAEYKAGKKSLLGLFMGEVMKASKGKADPKVATEILKKKLDV
jgi:aspartyl-tRNA(Asn)/glutamyl-tRNA(Gln) amidotransferase subunit B